MNPTTTDQLPPPPPLQQPPRSSFSCDRHPNESFNGFCPLCLCERLTTLDNNNPSSATTSTSRRNSTSSATAAIKSIFKHKSSSTTFVPNNNNNSTKTSSFFPELRRTKSFSAARNAELISCGYEPQRKSCDVRNTLYSLFSVENNEYKYNNNKQKQLGQNTNSTTTSSTDIIIDDQQQKRVDTNDCEIRNIVDEIEEISEEIAEQEKSLQKEEENKFEGDVEEIVLQELKTMKDHIHIDLDSNAKKSTTRSNFWSAASVLSKKWQKWRRKQKKSSPENDVVSSSTLPVKKPVSRQYRETQSEIADYGFGRRSCDVDPRFSLDAGRVSFDDPRYSFDEPRASWDGYLIGRTFPRLPPMVEDVPVVVHVPRSDMQISVEEHVVKNDESVPGGSVQTREYYTDSSSKRRKSLDRSNSIRKMAAAVVAEMDQTKEKTVTASAAAAAAVAVSNAKVTPASIDYGYPNRGLRFPSIGGERELGRDSNSNSLRDDCSETFELGINGGEKKEGKKSRRWRWKIWGFIQRRGSNKDDDYEGFSRVNGVERSFSESWQETGINKKVFRSNSSVSWRNSSKKSSSEINGFGNGKSRRSVGGDEFVLERNRSARYSPKHTDSGLLRFYLTPLRGSRRSRSTSNSNSVGKNILRPY
uniref:protein OCTOPUS-like n=1 Tax=Erigeron canadensis TaxID=72917 RepID=UPI001CB9289E|nr:protein OCTOPUS-like [Erigeron canadensis]XP_043622646.1 protein OCTOPUS-like [Erigeron canadensis]